MRFTAPRSLLFPLVLTLAFAAHPAFAAGTIVVDDFGPGCVLGGVWADNKGNNGEGKHFSGASCVGGAYHYTSNYAPRKKTGRETATWTPNLPSAGNYKVEVSWRGSENRSSKVTYEVRHAKGTQRFTVNQRSGDKTALGVFPFAAGRAGSVALVSDGGGSASADAAFFTPTTAGTTGGGTTLDNLIGGGKPGGAGGDGAALDGPGTKEFIAPADGTVRAKANLATYGPASLRVEAAGKPWLAWKRANDGDASPLSVNGKPDPDSIFMEKPGDPSSREVAHARKVKKGEKITLTLEGDFGRATPHLSVEFDK